MEASPETTGRVVKRRNKKGSACTHCRQLKFKCDAADTFPAPCTRCAKAKDGRHCTIDPSFRRTANKQRLDSLENELEQMRQELNNRQATPSITSPSVLGSAPRDGISNMASADAENSELAMPQPHSISTEMIDTVELSPNVTSRLIEEFYAHFHPHFPILPDQAVFFAKYKFNKLLLWTVLAIAARNSAEHTNLYQSLVDPVRRLAGDLYGSQSRSFETVQALLLLCVWPFPFQQTINDPSPMYIALATQLAYQLGLHRPAYRRDFTENNIPQADPGEHARKKVWFGCCVANQFVTSKLGTPSTIRPGHAVLSEIAEGTFSTIPEPLISELHLMSLASKASSALGDHEYSSSGILPDCLAMVRCFETDFMQLSERFKHRWGLETQILFHTQMLHLYSFALDSANTTDPLSRADVGVNEIYGKAFTTVLQLLRLVVSASNASSYWPVLIRYSVMYGIVIAIPVANLEVIGSPQRQELVSAIQEASVVMKSWSMFDRDHFTRVAVHVDWLNRKLQRADQGHAEAPFTILGVPVTRSQELGQSRKLTFSVKSRMATSIMYDVIWTAKYGEQARKQATNLPTDTGDFSAMNDLQMTGGDINLNELPLTMDDFAFTDGWNNSGFLDIFADWQGLIGIV